MQRAALEDLRAPSTRSAAYLGHLAAAAEGADGRSSSVSACAAIEFCDGLAKEFEDGTMSASHKECEILLAVMSRLTACIGGGKPEGH